MRLLSSIGALPSSTITLLIVASTLVVADATPEAPANGGLKIDTTRPATCTRKTKEGDTIYVNYRGTLQSDGSEFDSSLKPGRDPFSFTLGAHQVIKGWDLGLLGMCLGEGRRLTIPPELAYGNRNMGAIPAGSTLSKATIKGITCISTNNGDSL
jgi:FKBP-type peptidyl-prolyl cis-trans isomerase